QNHSRAPSDKFRVSVDESSKCPVCATVVYKAEQLVALDAAWHPACFTCGGTGDRGCKRRLALGHFKVNNKTPYCDVCCDKVVKENLKNFAPIVSDEVTFNLTSASATAAEQQNERYSVEQDYSSNLADDKQARRKSARFRVAPVIDDSMKCPVCSKAVYKTEAVVTLNASWHPLCFSCGGTGDLGCRKKLEISTYIGEGGNPYCKTCKDKLAKEAYAKSASTATVVFTEAQSNFSGFGVYDKPTGASNAVPFQSNSDSNPYAQSAGDNGFVSYELSDDVLRKPKPSVADKFRNLGSDGSKKCPICAKSVFRAEEMVALNNSYHPACFTCGAGKSDLGCNRRWEWASSKATTAVITAPSATTK
ncbi:unnamed protein product, partial [Sphagnum jensenii]